MASGIFVEKPFHPNLKCVIFGLILMILYWFVPRINNVFMLPIIFVLAYVSMAWYDYLYDCNSIMRSGSWVGPNTIDSIFKPQRRGENDTKYDIKFVQNQEQAYLSRVYLFHVLAVVPVLLYAGLKGNNADERIFQVLTVYGIVALLYHGTRMFLPRQTSC
jgi:hypothetical protein